MKEDDDSEETPMELLENAIDEADVGAALLLVRECTIPELTKTERGRPLHSTVKPPIVHAASETLSEVVDAIIRRWVEVKGEREVRRRIGRLACHCLEVWSDDDAAVQLWESVNRRWPQPCAEERMEARRQRETEAAMAREQRIPLNNAISEQEETARGDQKVFGEDRQKFELDVASELALSIVYAAAERASGVLGQFLDRVDDLTLAENATSLLYTAFNHGIYLPNIRLLMGRLGPSYANRVLESGKSLLMMAVTSYNADEQVAYLLDMMTDEAVSLQSKNGETALMRAKGANIEPIVDRTSPEDLLKVDIFGDTALHCMLDSKARWQPCLLERTPKEVLGMANASGQTPLFLAAVLCPSALLDMLRLASDDQVAMVSEDGDTLLMAAAKGGHLEAVLAVLTRDPSQKRMTNNAGKSAYDVAKCEEIRTHLAPAPKRAA